MVGNYRHRGPDVWYTCHHYGAFNTEPRMASYLGIAAGQIPQQHYFGTYRTFQNDNCDYSWTETKPVGEWKTYQGVRVFEGALPYRGMDIVPTWGGSMFEALMVPLFVPEETWGPRSVGRQPPALRAGPDRARARRGEVRLLGLLARPTTRPAATASTASTSSASNAGRLHLRRGATTVDQPFDGCRTGSPAPTSYGDGVVTPHASFLALRYAPKAALANLAKMRTNFHAYGAGGFYDAVAIRGRQGRRALPVARPGRW